MAKAKRKVDQTCPRPDGTLIIIGGKEDKGDEPAPDRETPAGVGSKDILRLLCDNDGKKKPRIMVITTGSEEGGETFEDYKKAFSNLNPSTLFHVHHMSRAEVIEDNSLEEKLKQSDVVFFTGGDQLLLTSMYGGTPFLTHLKEKYITKPLIVAGTSAGAMAMSTPMIFAGNEEVQQVSGEIKVTTGLEFLKDVCIDTHFVHRSRFIRLAQVIATNPGCTGIGIEEDTAIVIKNGNEAEVAGSGTVIVTEGFYIESSDMKNFADKKPISVRNLKVDILAPGDTFTIRQPNPVHQ